MGKDRAERFRFLEYRDRTTGARVQRLTPPETLCTRNYFYQKCWTEDGGRILFGSDLGGRMNLWLLDLSTGEARRLTDGREVNCQGAYLSCDDRFAFYTEGGRRHVRLDLETLEEVPVFEAPPGWTCYGTWAPDASCARVAGLLMLASDRAAGPGGWERFRRQFDAKPLMRLVDVDLAGGGARIVHEERRYLGHPMFRPFDDRLMSFCHEGPHDLVDSRIWFIDRDGSRLRRVTPDGNGASGREAWAAMHEFWVPDGSRLIYVGYAKGGQGRSIRAVDPSTLEDRRLMPMPACAHLMSDFRGRLLLGDGAGQLEDVEDKEGHAFSPDPSIYLFDLEALSCERVCEHDSSWAVYGGNTQAAHPHPSFSPDGRKALYASDAAGKPSLYLADLPPRRPRTV